MAAKVIIFSDRENTYNYTAHANFNCDSPEAKFKIYLLLQIFFDKCLKLDSYVLGTKTKLMIEPIFDSRLRSKNI